MPASPPQYHLCCQSLDRCSYVGPPRGRASGTLPPAARIESRFSLGTSGYGDSRWLGPRKNDSPADPTSWPAHWLPAGTRGLGGQYAASSQGNRTRAGTKNLWPAAPPAPPPPCDPAAFPFEPAAASRPR